MNTIKHGFAVSAVTISLVLAIVALGFVACESPDPTGPAATSRMTLTTTRTDMPADGKTTAEITAYVLDRRGTPAEGPIYWSTTCGTLSKASGTMSGGYSSVTFTASSYPCTAVITADAVHVKKEIEIQLYGYGMNITADPRHIPADGQSTSRILVFVHDHNNNPVSDGTSVSFTTTAGALSATSVPTNGGWASTILTSSTSPTTAEIIASVHSTTAHAWVTFTSTDVGSITLTASPSSGIPADGASTCVLQAKVVNVHGVPVRDTTVYFVTTNGALLPAQGITDANGVATTRLVAPYSNTNTHALVVAAAGGKESNTVRVDFSAYSGTPEPSPTSIPTVPPTATPANTPTPTHTPEPTHTSTPTPTFSPVPPTNTP